MNKLLLFILLLASIATLTSATANNSYNSGETLNLVPYSGLANNSLFLINISVSQGVTNFLQTGRWYWGSDCSNASIMSGGNYTSFVVLDYSNTSSSSWVTLRGTYLKNINQACWMHERGDGGPEILGPEPTNLMAGQPYNAHRPFVNATNGFALIANAKSLTNPNSNLVIGTSGTADKLATINKYSKILVDTEMSVNFTTNNYFFSFNYGVSGFDDLYTQAAGILQMVGNNGGFGTGVTISPSTAKQNVMQNYTFIDNGTEMYGSVNSSTTNPTLYTTSNNQGTNGVVPQVVAACIGSAGVEQYCNFTRILVWNATFTNDSAGAITYTSIHNNYAINSINLTIYNPTAITYYNLTSIPYDFIVVGAYTGFNVTVNSSCGLNTFTQGYANNTETTGNLSCSKLGSNWFSVNATNSTGPTSTFTNISFTISTIVQSGIIQPQNITYYNISGIPLELLGNSSYSLNHYIINSTCGNNTIFYNVTNNTDYIGANLTCPAGRNYVSFNVTDSPYKSNFSLSNVSFYVFQGINVSILDATNSSNALTGWGANFSNGTITYNFTNKNTMNSFEWNTIPNGTLVNMTIFKTGFTTRTFQINNSNSTLINYTFYLYNTNVTNYFNQTPYYSQVLEATAFQFNILLTSFTYTALTASINFTYNGTSYTLPLALLSGSNWTNTSTMPISNTTGTQVNQTIDYNVILNITGTDGFSYLVMNTPSNFSNFTLHRQYIGNCSDGITTTIALNYTEKIENGTGIAGDHLPVFYTLPYSYNRSYSFDRVNVGTNNTNFTYCLYPTWASFQISSIEQYDAPGFDVRTYALTNATISNSSNNITLWLGLDTKQTIVQAIYAISADPCATCKIVIQKFFPAFNNFQTITIGFTDSNGNLNAFLTPNSEYYRYQVYDTTNTLVLDQGAAPLTQLSCAVAATTCNVQLVIPNNEANPFLAITKNLYKNCLWNTTTLLFSCTVIDSTGLSTSATLNIYQTNALNFKMLNCTTSGSSSSTTLFCGPLSNTTRYYYTLALSGATYSNFVVDQGYFGETVSANTGQTGLFLALLIILFCWGSMLVSPGFAVIGTMIGITATYSLGLLSISTSSFTGLIAIAGLLLYKGKT